MKNVKIHDKSFKSVTKPAFWNGKKGYFELGLIRVDAKIACAYFMGPYSLPK